MIEILKILGLCVFAYFLGSIPYGYLLGRTKGIDIRTMGSGSTGSTNVGRALGLGYVILVTALDALKCFLPAFMARKFFAEDWIFGITVISTVLGHIYPVWLRFRAGKGVASALGGVSLVIPGDVVFVLIGLWASAFLSKRYVSLANLVFLLSLPAVFWLRYHSIWLYGFGIVLFCIIAWAHRQNIRDIADGKERKFDLTKLKTLFSKR